MGCAFSGLFPLPLLSKLVSKLDVLPGQFEVALLPPPVLPTHSGQVPVWAWGTGKKGRMSLIQHQGLRGQERPHSTSVEPLPSQAQFVAVNLWPLVSICQRTLGTPEKVSSKQFSCLSLISSSTRERHAVAMRCHILYVHRPRRDLPEANASARPRKALPLSKPWPGLHGKQVASTETP